MRAWSTNSFSARLSQQAFTASDVVELYLHRGAFEPALSDEDAELDPDRWCSHSAWGQECWQVIAQWVWNLRLEVGHRLEPTPVRTTEFAPALPKPREQAATCAASSPPAAGYGPPTSATRLGKRGALAEPTFLSSRMGLCAVPPVSHSTPMSGVASSMAVCAWSMRPAFATAARVPCASTVNGMGARPPSHAR